MKPLNAGNQTIHIFFPAQLEFVKCLCKLSRHAILLNNKEVISLNIHREQRVITRFMDISLILSISHRQRCHKFSLPAFASFCYSVSLTYIQINHSFCLRRKMLKRGDYKDNVVSEDSVEFLICQAFYNV
jgi:hypothetical protein